MFFEVLLVILSLGSTSSNWSKRRDEKSGCLDVVGVVNLGILTESLLIVLKSAKSVRLLFLLYHR